MIRYINTKKILWMHRLEAVSALNDGDILAVLSTRYGKKFNI